MREGGGPTIPPTLVRCTHSLFSRSLLPAPGYTPVSSGMLAYSAAPSGGSVHAREAQHGNNPWVGGMSALRDLKGVIVGMSLCAELLRSQR